MISRAKLANLVQRLRPSIEKYNRHSQYSPLSFFEVYTALAFIYFKQKKIDFAVLETGLGGRLDATNVVYPLVAAITPVSYEHTQKLGNTLTEIAGEKAGIIKRQKAKGKRKNLIVITAPQVEEAMKVIRKKCKQVGARLYEVGKDITYQKRKDGFSVKGIFGEYSDLKIRLLGDHQLINATLATAIAQTLRFYNIDIGITSIRDGLYNTLWPGRCEVVAEEPAVIIDGAQNIASSRALKETIKEKFKYKRLILILGISKDKDIEGICRELRGLVDKVILTKANNPRASNPEELARYFPGKDVYITYSVKEAKKKAWALADKQDLILITGSLFVVGEVRGDLG
jgi:dihydrofolate synthase/folylpolyglutamate synthase